MGRRYGQWIDTCIIGIEVLISGLFAFIFVLELINVVLRHAFSTGIPQATEGAAYALAVITFMGMAPAFLADEHVRLEVVRRKLPTTLRRAVVVVAELLTLFTLAYLVYLGTVNATRFFALPFAPASMPWLPFWIPMTAVPLGAALSAIALVRLWNKRTRGPERPAGNEFPFAPTD